MIATDKIQSCTKRLIHFFPHIISSIIILHFEFLPTQRLKPNNDSASKEMKKHIRLLQYTRPNTDSVPHWWSLVMFHADKQWGGQRAQRSRLSNSDTRVSSWLPSELLIFHSASGPCFRVQIPSFAFPSSRWCGGGRGCRRIRHVTEQCHDVPLHLIENHRKWFESLHFSSADARIGT